MTSKLYPYDLTWAEVDPKAHRFDAEAAEGVVRGLPPGRDVLAGRVELTPAWADDMTAALVQRYGRWAVGWRWARDEGDLGGGPVGAWCCPDHSMKSPEGTVQAVAAALGEWRAWLERLAEQFGKHPLKDADPVARHRIWRRAAIELIAMVVDQTSAGDAWYTHCQQVLGWYLSRWGVPDQTAFKAVRKAVRGRFESWIEPPADLVGEVVTELRLSKLHA